MTGAELIKKIKELNAEDLQVYVGSSDIYEAGQPSIIRLLDGQTVLEIVPETCK